MWVSFGVGYGGLAQIPKGFICIGIVPLKTLKNDCFSLSHVLLFAGYAGDGIKEVGTIACKVPFAILCGSCDGTGDFPNMIQFWTIHAFLGFAGILNVVKNVSNLSK